MNKRKIILIIVAVLFFTACNLSSGFGFRTIKGSGVVITETRDFTDFADVDVCCGMELKLTQGESYSLTIEADDNLMAEIESSVVANRLTIKFQDSTNVNYRPSQPVRLYLKVIDIQEVSISGGGMLNAASITSDSFELGLSGGSDAVITSLEADFLNIIISGGGDISAVSVMAEAVNLDLSGGSDADIKDLTAATLEMETSGGGSAEIIGIVGESIIDLGGGSSLQGQDLLSKNATISCSGGGSSHIWVEETLEVNLSGGCLLQYYGKPSITAQSLSGGSELISLGER